MTTKLVVAAILVMAASNLQAQARITESRPMGATTAPVAAPGAAQVNANAELYYQVQTLQQELLELRGLVEQQTHEIKRLKQQRLDDYVDLDRRVSQLSQSKGGSGAGATAPARPSGDSVADSDAGSMDVASSAQELASYRAAIDLILKKQDFDGGVAALKEYLSQYPSGSYAANAQYWLGQIYLQKNELEQSKEWFGRMIAAYPQHQKAPEAKFKLAKTHHLLGDKPRARTLLQEVADSNSAAADLAKQYLKQNF